GVLMSVMAVGFSEADGVGIYTVEKGDTLWSIAGKLFNDPSKWRDIWDYNPQIKSPNSLHKGEVLNIPDDIFGELDAVKGRVLPDAQQLESEDSLQIMGEEPKVIEVEEIKIGDLPTTNVKKLRELEKNLILKSGYIDNTFAPIGKIAAGLYDSFVFGINDYVYLKTDSQHKKFYIVHEAKKVKDKDGYYGKLIEVLGICEVLHEENGYKKAIIKKSYTYIPINSLLLPYYDFELPLYEYKIMDSKIDASIVAIKDVNLFSSFYDIVYVNKGRTSSLKPGQIYRIYTKNKPVREIGLVKLLTVQEGTASGYVINNKIEVNIGDRLNPL
ncbi:MAG: LysM peptidoglycan-binding domain-containing protein, partial [Candidatus Magnetoovum sp. WYHC-5]|nr:LysM peptidoglycan-binding domain-containing protein [Candidatus Magnetoovum sp. WYHC-5]